MAKPASDGPMNAAIALPRAKVEKLRVRSASAPSEPTRLWIETWKKMCPADQRRADEEPVDLRNREREREPGRHRERAANDGNANAEAVRNPAGLHREKEREVANSAASTPTAARRRRAPAHRAKSRPCCRAVRSS